MKISPSILAAPLEALGAAAEKLDPAITDFLHMDIMDGHFVPPITFGEDICKAVGQSTAIPLDIHLMVANPELEVPKYFSLKPAMISFHFEATSFPIRLGQSIQAAGIKSGIALNPATATDCVAEIHEFFDFILVMTVEPGYYGQKFLLNGLKKIQALKKMKDNSGAKFLIQVDGGIHAENARLLSTAGADILVAGSFIFKSDDYNARIRELKQM